jgi:hypothetical protein
MVYTCIGMIIKAYIYQSLIQKLYFREGQTMQWPKDTRGVIRMSKLWKNTKFNGQKIPEG